MILVTDDLVSLGRLLPSDGGVARRGRRAGLWPARWIGLSAGRGGCGVKGGRQAVAERSRQRPLRPEGRPRRLRGAAHRHRLKCARLGVVSPP
jgi:hypothetical protein